MDVAIDLIKPSPYQPRLTFEVEDLKEEIQKDGLLSALVVRKRDEYYELLDGERRWRALKELGWKIIPVDIREVSDVIARRTVYKLNKIRDNYSAEEEAKFFKKLANEGMKPYQIETELGVEHHWVQACLNVFEFPEDIQKHIFGLGVRPIYFYLSDVRDLEPVINRNPEEATALARQIIAERLSQEEKRKLIGRRVTVIDEARLKAVEKALPEVAPEIHKLETPEDLKLAAAALRKEAKKRAEAMMTPEQKAALEAEQEAWAAAKARREEERRQREEEERRHREEIAMKKARQELKSDAEFIEEALGALSPEARDQLVYGEVLTKEKIKMEKTQFEVATEFEGEIYKLGDRLSNIGYIAKGRSQALIAALRYLQDKIKQALEILTGQKQPEVPGIIEGEARR